MSYICKLIKDNCNEGEELSVRRLRDLLAPKFLSYVTFTLRQKEVLRAVLKALLVFPNKEAKKKHIWPLADDLLRQILIRNRNQVSSRRTVRAVASVVRRTSSMPHGKPIG